jgi:hypothetical protein
MYPRCVEAHRSDMGVLVGRMDRVCALWKGVVSLANPVAAALHSPAGCAS